MESCDEDDLAALEALDGGKDAEDDLAALEALDAAAPAPPPPTKKLKKEDLEIEPLSGIRISLDPKTRRLDRGAVAALASASAMKKMEEVPPLLRKSNPVAAPASWLTIAALRRQGPGQAEEQRRLF